MTKFFSVPFEITLNTIIVKINKNNYIDLSFEVGWASLSVFFFFENYHQTNDAKNKTDMLESLSKVGWAIFSIFNENYHQTNHKKNKELFSSLFLKMDEQFVHSFENYHQTKKENNKIDFKARVQIGWANLDYYFLSLSSNQKLESGNKHDFPFRF